MNINDMEKKKYEAPQAEEYALVMLDGVCDTIVTSKTIQTGDYENLGW